MQICENMPDMRFGLSARLHLAKIYQLQGALSLEVQTREAILQSARRVGSVTSEDLVVMASSLTVGYLRTQRFDDAVALLDLSEGELLPRGHWLGLVHMRGLRGLAMMLAEPRKPEACAELFAEAARLGSTHVDEAFEAVGCAHLHRAEAFRRLVQAQADSPQAKAAAGFAADAAQEARMTPSATRDPKNPIIPAGCGFLRQVPPEERDGGDGAS